MERLADHVAAGDAERAAERLGAADGAARRSGARLEPFEQEIHERTVAAGRAAEAGGETTAPLG